MYVREASSPDEVGAITATISKYAQAADNMFHTPGQGLANVMKNNHLEFAGYTDDLDIDWGCDKPRTTRSSATTIL